MSIVRARSGMDYGECKTWVETRVETTGQVQITAERPADLYGA